MATSSEKTVTEQQRRQFAEDCKAVSEAVRRRKVARAIGSFPIPDNGAGKRIRAIVEEEAS